MSTDLVHYGDGPSNCPACTAGRYGSGKNLQKIQEQAAEHLAAIDLMALKFARATELHDKLTERANNSGLDLIEDGWKAANRSPDEEIRAMQRSFTADLLSDHKARTRALLDSGGRALDAEAGKSVIPEKPHYQERRRWRK